MRTIWKFDLKVQDRVTVTMPRHSAILSLQVQNGVPYIWAAVDTEEPREGRTFLIYGTGQPIEVPWQERRFVGTFQLLGALVFHVFEHVA